MDKIKIVILGGNDEYQKQMCAIEINDDIFVVGTGMKLPDKTKPGVDFIIARYDYLIENKSRVKGYFLCHGHDSIIGGLPYIYEKVPAPIYVTKSISLFVECFCKHNKLDFSKLAINIVGPSDDIKIGGRLIRLFAVACNFADSFGISFSTDQGNVVFISNFVIYNDYIPGFVHDISKISRICEEKTLVLLLPSEAAETPGYCSPHYRLLNLVKQTLNNIPGRIFVCLDTPDIFNIVETINDSVKNNRKIIPYDEETKQHLELLIKMGYLVLKKDSIASIEDVNRIRPQELVILMTGFGNSINAKIALLASGNNDDKIIFINPTDTFMLANHIMPLTETSATDALDELHHHDCKIIRLTPKNYYIMHACEEDIKTMIAMFRPKYYIPVGGVFKKLLANAKLAAGMNLGLNHTNIFLVDNGNIIEFENGKGYVSQNKVTVGDLFIDGKGVGDIENSILEERQRFSDDGVIILGATISESQRKVVAGPDVQARGLVFIKDSESLMRELTRLFISTIENELAKETYSLKYIEEAVKDIVFKAVRRALNKTPIIIPIIEQIK